MLHVIRRLYVGYAVAGLAMLWPDVKRLAFDWLPDNKSFGGHVRQPIGGQQSRSGQSPAMDNTGSLRVE